MRWTIAILTTPERKTDLERILGILKHQMVKRYPIEILVADQPWSVAQKRQWCLDNAQGQYFNFIDDDDLIAPDYIEVIWPHLDGTDYIGFKQQYYFNGHKKHVNDLSVSHLTPILTEIAQQGSFVSGPGEELCEDYRWASQVHPVTKHFIDKVLYFYFDRGTK